MLLTLFRFSLSDRSYNVLLRYAYLLCETEHCVNATGTQLMSVLEVRRELGGVGRINNQVIPVMGIILESLAVLACLAALVVICFVWKVAPSAALYVALLVLLLMIEVFQLAHWIVSLRVFYLFTSSFALEILQG